MNEPLLARLWLSGGWPGTATIDCDGRRFSIVYPGRSGHGAGPDLHDAILARDDGSLVRGDVEFHVRASDWERHGHTGDRRYADVIAHVVWRNDRAEAVVRPGETARPMLTFEMSGIAPAILFHRLALPAPPCAPTHAWVREQAREARTDFFNGLGDERLAEKALHFGADLHAVGEDQALFIGICEALGYSHNRAPMRSLAEELPAATLRAIMAAASDPESAERAGFAELCRVAGFDRSARRGAWDLAATRPANRPERRLAGLARLLARDRQDSLLDRLTRCVDGEPRLAARRLESLFRVDRAGTHPMVTIGTDSPRSVDFWLDHSAVDRAIPGGPVALIGRSRALAIVANVALPAMLALADQRGDEVLSAAAWAIWPHVAASGPNWILDEMRDVTDGVNLGRARQEQGVIALFRRCCAERRCDLADACRVRGVG